MPELEFDGVRRAGVVPRCIWLVDRRSDAGGKMMGLLTGRGCDPATLAEKVDKSLLRQDRMWGQ